MRVPSGAHVTHSAAPACRESTRRLDPSAFMMQMSERTTAADGEKLHPKAICLPSGDHAASVSQVAAGGWLKTVTVPLRKSKAAISHRLVRKRTRDPSGLMLRPRAPAGARFLGTPPAAGISKNEPLGYIDVASLVA